jgi:hypothetical protein
VLNPSQFQVNEAWIIFRLNDAPIHTDQDGSFNCIGLMDAASCFMLDSAFVPADKQELSKSEARRLLKAGWSHKEEFPATLFIPAGQFQTNMPAEAKREGISVVPIDENQLLVFISEARQSFREHFRSGDANSDA